MFLRGNRVCLNYDTELSVVYYWNRSKGKCRAILGAIKKNGLVIVGIVKSHATYVYNYNNKRLLQSSSESENGSFRTKCGQKIKSPR